MTPGSIFEDLFRRYPALESCRSDIDGAYRLLQHAYARGGKLLLCGNGGSASDCDHWAGELLKGFGHPRPLASSVLRGILPETAYQLQWALPAIPLTGFSSFLTAFANDKHPEFAFAQLVLALGRPGDILAAISTSGNSANVCRAAEVARSKKLPVLGLTGATGGSLKGIAEVCICVPETQTPLVQELHLPIYHCLSLMLENHFAAQEGILEA